MYIFCNPLLYFSRFLRISYCPNFIYCVLIALFVTPSLMKIKSSFAFAAGIEVGRGLSLQIHGLIVPFEDLLKSALEEEENEEAIAQKIPLLLLETISKLIGKIMFDELKIEDVPKHYTMSFTCT